VGINCSAIPKDPLESELFGYEEGAFTGAKSKGKPRKFEPAHKFILKSWMDTGSCFTKN
jgi:transcriptional regulator with PAS, ATPase and Fis domain